MRLIRWDEVKITFICITNHRPTISSHAPPTTIYSPYDITTSTNGSTNKYQLKHGGISYAGLTETESQRAPRYLPIPIPPPSLPHHTTSWLTYLKPKSSMDSPINILESMLESSWCDSDDGVKFRWMLLVSQIIGRLYPTHTSLHHLMTYLSEA